MVDLLWTHLASGAGPARATLLLAHGAGAPMTSPWLEGMASLLAARGIAVARFELAYMAARRRGARKPPPRAEKLVDEYRAVIAVLEQERVQGPLLIGGKSMGGRVASLLADELYREHRIAGLVCLGYPFHPPGKPEQLRTAHLEGLVCPALIVQGERDPFGTRADVAGYALSSSIRLAWIAGGDHDLAPKGGKAAKAAALAEAADVVAEWAGELSA
jgi:hypothetical protein